MIDRVCGVVGGVVQACWQSPSWLRKLQRVSSFVSDVVLVVAEEMKVDGTSSLGEMSSKCRFFVEGVVVEKTPSEWVLRGSRLPVC
jgi:hypothetical protein